MHSNHKEDDMLWYIVCVVGGLVVGLMAGGFNKSSHEADRDSDIAHWRRRAEAAEERERIALRVNRAKRRGGAITGANA